MHALKFRRLIPQAAAAGFEASGGEVRATAVVTLRKIGSLIRLNPQEIEFHPMVAAAVSHALHYMATFSASMKKRIIEGGLVPVLFRCVYR